MDQPDRIEYVERSPAYRPSPASASTSMPAHDPDRDVLDLVDRGDLKDALRRLMARHGTAMYRFCCDALHDPGLADDVHQQVFIEAFRDLPTFARRSTVRAWIFGIARHRVLDAAKGQRRARARRGETDLAQLPDVGPAPRAALEAAQLHDALVACVRELDHDIRVALLLRYQQGFTFEDMARMCGEKSGTLQARVARALPVLRARIEHRLARRRAR